MNNDDLKVLNILYNFSVNSVAKYVSEADIYYENERDEREGKKFLHDFMVSFNNISSNIEEICIQNKVSLSLGTFNPKYLDLNYLSYKFVKNYVEKEVESQREYLQNIIKELSISEQVKNLVMSF